MRLALFVMVSTAASFAAAQRTVLITSSSGLARALDSGALRIPVAGAMTNAAAQSHSADGLLPRHRLRLTPIRCTGMQC